MSNEELTQKIKFFEPDAETAIGSQYVTVTVSPDKLNDLAKKLKESEDTFFDYLFCLTGMDWGDNLGVVYHLDSTKYHHNLVLKTKTTDREHPAIDSVCDIWKTAEFLEREVFDLFGITFNNHPDMRRIFLEDDWKGYPLRKDYVDKENIVER
ncbi:MAG: NADH-quinone oxidoreductase subunit C [Bacteroidia bacterium]|nr:NADH-quinone oxidoreductase subunit C [Bacteroidia bacterium]